MTHIDQVSENVHHCTHIASLVVQCLALAEIAEITHDQILLGREVKGILRAGGYLWLCQLDTLKLTVDGNSNFFCPST